MRWTFRKLDHETKKRQNNQCRSLSYRWKRCPLKWLRLFKIIQSSLWLCYFQVFDSFLWGLFNILREFKSFTKTKWKSICFNHESWYKVSMDWVDSQEFCRVMQELWKQVFESWSQRDHRLNNKKNEN